jgi:ABC-2 type transport system ATP-binding protein
MDAGAGPSEPILMARGLVKRFGDVVAVDGLDLQAHAGTCLGLLGPNGAGKTTTIEMLEGLKTPDAGEIRVLGLAWRDAPRAIRAGIGVQLQATEFQEKLTVRETLRMYRSLYSGGRSPDEAIRQVGLEEKRDSRVGTLSGGQKQRLALGCALLHDPRLLFLDEPTTGLDPQARRHVWEIIETFKRSGRTVLLTTHYMDEAERLCDDLLIVDHGKAIAEGTPAEIIRSLGAESVVECTPVGGDSRALPEEELRALPGVTGVRREPGRLRLTVTSTQDAIAGLFALAARHGTPIDDLATHRATLEDVFVSLTGKHLRDE